MKSICKLFLHVPLQTWKDSNLAWNPDEFGGVEQVRMPISSIWSPDLRTYNRFVGSFTTILYASTITVTIV